MRSKGSEEKAGTMKERSELVDTLLGPWQLFSTPLLSIRAATP